MILDEEASNSDFDGHEDKVHTNHKPDRPPENASKVVGKTIKQATPRGKDEGQHSFIEY